MALKQNEDDRALFLKDPTPEYNTFTDLDVKGKKLTLSEGVMESGLEAALEMLFKIRFYDVAEEYVKEDGTFTVMLQTFPLVTSQNLESAATEPISEPATGLLFGAGLIGLFGMYRRKRQ